MKKYVFIMLSLVLSSCLYDPQAGCVRPIIETTASSCYKGRSYPPIAHYQKLHHLGNTNSEQRWKDVVSCGGKYGDESLRSAMTKDKNGPIDKTMQKKFRQCMENKGYVRIQDCGLKNSSSDTKQCN
ncbi:hypothetical protein [Necropsobacter massiliensis]|uniref:hypothetical protein n=1 Tax=Necropsobacter massiliensis TaxID=1400001 RepID=UPI00117DA15B|nr:hypothetical protein [Necropsobacter massiliensis]